MSAVFTEYFESVHGALSPLFLVVAETQSGLSGLCTSLWLSCNPIMMLCFIIYQKKKPGSDW
jgi:hypothetical protein